MKFEYICSEFLIPEKLRYASMPEIPYYISELDNGRISIKFNIDPGVDIKGQLLIEVEEERDGKVLYEFVFKYDRNEFFVLTGNPGRFFDHKKEVLASEGISSKNLERLVTVFDELEKEFV